MPQDGVMPEKFIWFCRGCETKGNLLGNDMFDVDMADRQHEISSPGCGDLVRISKLKDTLGDPFIPSFVNWDD